MFSNKLGCFKGEPVSLRLKEGSEPKFCRYRTVPLALQDKVNQALDKLVDENILCPVNSSEWATPIVPVQKKTGEVRICADYKTTLNTCLHIDKYPLPTSEQLLAKIGRACVFSCMDLSQAYHQLPLSEEASRLTVISTQKACFDITACPTELHLWLLFSKRNSRKPLPAMKT